MIHLCKKRKVESKSKVGYGRTLLFLWKNCLKHSKRIYSPDKKAKKVARCNGGGTIQNWLIGTHKGLFAVSISPRMKFFYGSGQQGLTAAKAVAAAVAGQTVW